MAMEIPRALVEPLIPPQFFGYGSAPGTVQVSVDIRECPRVVGNDTVYGPVSIFRSQAVVEARNHAWRNQGWIGRYQLDFATSSAALAAKMQELGWPAHVATITHEATPLPNNAKTMTWHVDSKNYSIRSDYPVDHDAPQWSGGNYHYWYGEQEFRRMDSQEVYHIDALITGGELIVQGEAKLRRVTVGPAAQWEGDSHDDRSATWALNSTVFK